MIYFACDYNEGAHPKIMQRLLDTNMEQCEGYGTDEHCENARRLIKEACARDDADVHFLVGGTQANTTVIAAALRPYQGVLSPVSGHINAHETGAVEATGHKVLPLDAPDGKITAEQIRTATLNQRYDESFEHIVQPKMVYISHPAENGMLYSLSDLTAISDTCHELGLYLFIDGARLGYGLTSPMTDVTLHDIARLADVFYIGGTKVGALFGEAVVITNSDLKTDFRYMIKRHGGMFAKGRLLGIQFETLFTDGLYFEIAKGAIDKAFRIKAALKDAGFELWADSPTNQQFAIFTKEQLNVLNEKYKLTPWCELPDGRWAVRICTSWATTDENVDALIEDIKKSAAY